MANTSLFDVIEDAAATSPTLAPPEPKEPEAESPFDGVSPTDFDADGNPIATLDDPEATLADKYAAQRELNEDDEAEYAATCGEAGPEVPEDPDPFHGEDIPDEICACMMVDDWAEQEDEIEPDETQTLAETPADAPLETDAEHRAALECSHDGDTYLIVAEHVNGRWEVAAQDEYGKEYTRKLYHYARADEGLPGAAAAQGVNVKRSGVRDFQTTPEFGKKLAQAVVERIKKYGWEFISHNRLDLVIT